eukprot:g14937.t1
MTTSHTSSSPVFQVPSLAARALFDVYKALSARALEVEQRRPCSFRMMKSRLAFRDCWSSYEAREGNWTLLSLAMRIWLLASIRRFVRSLRKSVGPTA